MPNYNPNRAEVPLTLPGGPTLKLVMDYQAVSALQVKFGDEWDTKIAEAERSYNFHVLFATVEILAAKNHSDLTAADIMAYGPPWLEVMTAINAAHNVFMYGGDGPKMPVGVLDGDEEKGESAQEAGEGKSPLANGQAGASLSAARWKRLLQLVYRQPTSGQRPPTR